MLTFKHSIRTRECLVWACPMRLYEFHFLTNVILTVCLVRITTISSWQWMLHPTHTCHEACLVSLQLVNVQPCLATNPSGLVFLHWNPAIISLSFSPLRISLCPVHVTMVCWFLPASHSLWSSSTATEWDSNSLCTIKRSWRGRSSFWQGEHNIMSSIKHSHLSAPMHSWFSLLLTFSRLMDL